MLAAEVIRVSIDRDLQVYGQILNSLTSFKFLGWILTDSDDDWLTLVGNLRKVRKTSA